jgi:hypothetical protein
MNNYQKTVFMRVPDQDEPVFFLRMQKDPDMLEEYDFSKGVQGKYAKRYAEGTNVVVIDPDVAEIFPDHDSVNQALRSLAEIIKKHVRIFLHFLHIAFSPFWRLFLR